MNLKDLEKKIVLILGAGKTGIASALFLKDKVNKLLISEKKEASKDFNKEIQELIKSGVEVEFNGHSDRFINKVDLIIISPGISPHTEVVKKIISLGTPLISDIELASYFISKPIIAVTGTNGKTTTTSLITHLINNSEKKAIACGNIGKPLIEMINNAVDYYVLEISSYQIFYSPNLSADIAVCLNITSDHLDWHESFNHYIESKKKLLSQQKENSWAVLNLGDAILKNLKPKNNVFYFSPFQRDLSLGNAFSDFAFYENNFLKVREKENIHEIINKDELNIIGTHNIENALASIAVCKIIDLNNQDLKKGLKSFQGVEHRLEFVKKVNGKDFYNDSKATNPEATVKAIEAISGQSDSQKITLILGGKDKNTSLEEMTKIIKRNACEVILYGEAKERFKKELLKGNVNGLRIVQDLNEAVEVSLKSKTDVVLFSPACSSFDMFKNYEERGKLFKELVCKY